MSAEKRQAILEGMLEVVGSDGYDATSVRTVLAHTGLYRQAFYDNFADKHECYLAAFDMQVDRLEALLAEAAAEETSWLRRLRAGLTALLDFLDAEPNVGRALVVEVHALGAPGLARRTEAMQCAVEFVERAREEASIQSPPPIAAEGIVAGMHAMIHARLAGNAEGSFRSLLPDFMYFATMPYFGGEAARAEMRDAKLRAV
ncbi:MAG TPA: TetR/AcrR family transcriptional regulator [Solirubrobacterales bacterium]|nr:TetR/AcrR family transcriptional regulator [Solirubrobacterales bacterium]